MVATPPFGNLPLDGAGVEIECRELRPGRANGRKPGARLDHEVVRSRVGSEVVAAAVEAVEEAEAVPYRQDLLPPHGHRGRHVRLVHPGLREARKFTVRPIGNSFETIKIIPLWDRRRTAPVGAAVVARHLDRSAQAGRREQTFVAPGLEHSRTLALSSSEM